ncbi:MAG: hypothetical protein H0X41_08455 [Chitinophagaceae bacterium]|nr:hypothetical protein [Chitinophagaceae bacterium]
MKIIIIAAFFLLTSTIAGAQSYPKMISYKNVLQPSLVLPLPNTTDIAEQTILNKLKETGYKPETKGKLFWKKNKQEGFYVFPGVQLPELNNQKLDLYFKVDPVTDPVNRSSITLLVSKGYDNFVTPQVDSTTFLASQDFLNSFVSETAAFKLNKEVETQKQKVKESEKKWQDLRNQQEDARKKISELEANVKNWQDEEVKQKTYLDSARTTLQTLEGQQTSSNASGTGTTK